MELLSRDEGSCWIWEYRMEGVCRFGGLAISKKGVLVSLCRCISGFVTGSKKESYVSGVGLGRLGVWCWRERVWEGCGTVEVPMFADL